MALIGDDQVKGVNGDVELVGVIISSFIAKAEGGVPAEEVDRHSLDR